MLTLADMRALLRKGLGGLDSTDMPDPEADRLLNMSLWELENKFPFKEKECLIVTPIIAGQSEYGLPSAIDAIITVSVLEGVFPHSRRKLQKASFDTMSEQPEGTTDASFRGAPSYYNRREHTLILYPVPEVAGAALEVLMWRGVESLIDDPAMSVGLPRNWHELVVEGGIVRGHFYNEDYNLAQQATNFQTAKVRSAVSTDTKEDRDNRYAGVKVLWEAPQDHDAKL